MCNAYRFNGSMMKYPYPLKIGSLSKALRLVLLRLPGLKRSGESTSRWLSETKYKKTRLRSLKPLLFSFAQPNSFAQRRMAVVRLARTIKCE